MTVTGSTALVTGANRGLGTWLVRELLGAGAARVYATARNPEAVRTLDFAGDPRVSVLPLDITNAASVAAAVAAAPDVTLLVNNAGVLSFGGAADADLVLVERDLATNYVGTIRVTRAFLPLLEGNRPSVIANVLTLIALAPVPGMAGYSASKAAAHSMTQALRADLRGRGIRVVAAYPGGIDTDMLAGVEAEKADPALVAARIVAGIDSGEAMIWPDDASAGAGSVYLDDPVKLEQLLAG